MSDNVHLLFFPLATKDLLPLANQIICIRLLPFLLTVIPLPRISC